MHEKLTFTGLRALEPRVVEVCVTRISAFVEPSPAASATTQLAGFLESATLETAFACSLGRSCRRGCFCGHVNVIIAQQATILTAAYTDPCTIQFKGPGNTGSGDERHRIST